MCFLVAVVVALLQGPLSSSADVAQQGLLAIQNLAAREDNRKLLAVAGACEGEQAILFLLQQAFDLRFSC